MDISICMFNGLSDNLTSNAELFADDTSFFSVVQDANTSAKELNDDLTCLALTGAIRDSSKEKKTI